LGWSVHTFSNKETTGNVLINPAGQTEVVEAAPDGEDFLARERAALGDDADQFITPNDRAVTAEDAGDDLLGAKDSGLEQREAADEVSGFEKSFPAIDAENEVHAF